MAEGRGGSSSTVRETYQLNKSDSNTLHAGYLDQGGCLNFG